MPTLYLIRHGSTAFNVEKRFQGQSSNLPLNEQGITEAELLPALLQRESYKTIYCSPLLRARQTAQIIGAANPKPIIIQEELTELDMGSLSGRLMADCREEMDMFKNYFFQYQAPDGESVLHLYERAVRTVNHIVQETNQDNAVIVSHLCVIRCIMKWAGRTDAEAHNFGAGKLCKIEL